MTTGAGRDAENDRSSGHGGLASPLKARVLIFDEIDSTNAEARRRAEAGDAGPLWIVARRQTAGRGRRGRAWETGPGNLAATRLITTAKPPLEAAQIAFVVALAIADVAAKYVGAEGVKVKWPNDVMIDGRKTAGVLVESGVAGEGRLWLAVGVGINLATPPSAADSAATSFAAHLLDAYPSPPSPEAALDDLHGALKGWIAVWDGSGFEAVAHAWTKRAYGLGGACTVRLARETLGGVAEGLDVDGAFRLRLADGSIRRIMAGDVFFSAGPGDGAS